MRGSQTRRFVARALTMTVLSLPSATFACFEYFFDWGNLGWDGTTTGGYPYTRTFTNVDGSGIDVTLTIPRRHRGGDSGYLSTPPQDLDTYTGSTTAFRYYRQNDAIIDTITMNFSQPIVAGPMVFGGSRLSSGVHGTIEFRAYRAGSVVLPNTLVHPNPITTTDIVRGTALGDPAGAALTMTHNTGLGNDLNGAYATGRPGVDDGYVIVGLTAPPANRNWGIVDYQGVEVDSLSWEIWQSNVVDPQTARENIGTGGNISGYFGSFRFVKAGTCDLGDLPATYNTTMRHNDGARHVIGPVFLGLAIDSEGNGQTSAGADGDDNNQSDDEDGVVFRAPAGAGGTVFADVTVANSTASEVTLYGWLDTNRDGTFDDSEREVITAVDPSTSFEWVVADTTAQTYYARFRVCSIQSQCSSAFGTASDGEVEDYAITYDPTAVTIGRVTLAAVATADFLAGLDVEGMGKSALLNLLDSWDPELAESLAGSERTALLQALRDYLDLDGDGQVAVLSWETLEQRGTVGFYAERREGDGTWTLVNSDMLPVLVTAPMGSEYQLADPVVRAGAPYQYQLIELEADGSTRSYGPYSLEMP